MAWTDGPMRTGREGRADGIQWKGGMGEMMIGAMGDGKGWLM